MLLQCASHQAYKRYSDTMHRLYTAVYLGGSRSMATHTLSQRCVESDRVSYGRQDGLVRVTMATVMQQLST